MKIKKIVHGHGFTYNMGAYPKISVYNTAEREVREGEDIEEINAELRQRILEQNIKDFRKQAKY